MLGHGAQIILLNYRRKNMSNLQRIDSQSLNKILVGFDRIFDTLEPRFMNQLNSNYPPHNIIRVDDYNYIIEVAIAGFKKEEIVVSIEQEILTITGSKNKTDDSGLQYLHRGLSSRDFVRSFTLAEHIVVKNAVISDGILSIKLEHIIPEEKKPRLIEITQLD